MKRFDRCYRRWGQRGQGIVEASTTCESEVELLEVARPIREQLKALYNLDEEVVSWRGSWPAGNRGWNRRTASSDTAHPDGPRSRTGKGAHGSPCGSSRRALRLELADGCSDGRPDTAPSQAVDADRDHDRLGPGRTIIGTAGEFKPLVVDGEYLYLQKMLHLENRFVEALRRRLEAAIPAWSPEVSEEHCATCWCGLVYRDGSPVALATEQMAAVRRRCNIPITIVSGGPGTGKTTIVLSILRVLRRLGVTCEEFALAAPTGKAANRMGEAIQAGRQGIADPVA